MAWTASESGDKYFCACKRTKGAPFCDGSHKNL
jgi:CDGSH-type Zn-finger protein